MERRARRFARNNPLYWSMKVVRQYTMRISRMTVDKLGVKLYDRVYAVIAELISNSYDADAKNVFVRAPMGQYLATKTGNVITSKNVFIEVEDDGSGMSPDQLQDFYLIVGSERRSDPKRGDVSPKFQRKVMGRKGVGKLAPFGVCRIVEIVSAGGIKISEGDEEGYRVAHIILNKDGILSDTEQAYQPKTGDLDGTLSPNSFTKITLREFYYRRVGNMEELARQLSQRFGLSSANWCVSLEDTTKTVGHPDYSTVLGAFQISVMANSKIEFTGPKPTESKSTNLGYGVLNPDGTECNKLLPGFNHEGFFYPIVGWVAYAKEPYKDELMAGVRIYCRGKFAAQTVVFNRGAGFTGEHSVRSYLVGEIYADWLDESEDLIQTDRRDVLWSHELGAAFQEWGQKVVLHIGQITRDPMRQAMTQKFIEIGNVSEKIREAFPQREQKKLRDSAMDVAKLLGKSLRGDELSDPKAVDDMVQLSLLLAPLRTLDEMLREAADEDVTPLSVVNDILRTARLAETITFGRQIENRLKIIHRLESLKDMTDTPEAELQKLIESAPWLVNPQWSPVTSNQALKTLKKEFAKFFREKTGQPIQLGDFTEPNKRPDFVLFSQDGKLQIIEIKKPKHQITNEEMDRIITYFEQFEAFLADEKHREFKKIANHFHLTLVCDGEKLSGAQKKAYTAYIDEKNMTPIDWASFLLRTEKTHEEFLVEADRLKRND